jgi:teichuronic acid biosynthesis glycosyltransferase TuaC
MRIAHVTDTFLPKIGGAEIAIDQLVQAMGRAGDTCSVLAQRPQHVSGEIVRDYPLLRFPNPRSSLWAGGWIEHYLKQLANQSGPFDVVIGHHAFPPGYACVKYANKHRIPSIVYPRGGDIYEVSRFRRKKLAWRKLTWALANASAIVCASAAMETTVRGIIGDKTAQGRIVRIPNGVNLAELRGDAGDSIFASDIRLQSPFILALGRTIKRKGFHLVLEAVARIPAAQCPLLVIAGDGRELDALKLQAQPLGDRVLFTGLVNGADKRWLLQHCQFMVAPSLEESFGNVALEAMACGKPVIASQASGFAEIVVDHMNGKLVPVGDVESLQSAITQITSSDLSAYGRAALATAEQFSWESIAARYHQLIVKLLNGTPIS